jgi:hypothetical protein
VTSATSHRSNFRIVPLSPQSAALLSALNDKDFRPAFILGHGGFVSQNVT